MTKIISKIKKITRNGFLKSSLVYTPLFAFMAFFIVLIFDKYDVGFIKSGDGLKQHIITLKYFRDLLINFIKTGTISTFTWQIGCGLDLFSNLAYYIFGDIFSYVSILFKTSRIEMLYYILIIVRMYFVGISFLCYCKYKKMNLLSSIIGALMYTFSSFVLFAAVRHPYFINAVIIFPLLMIGIEKIIIEGKPIFYTLIIAITFLINFYFAYMLSLIIAIYGTLLAIYAYKEEGLRKIIKILLKTLLYSVLGISISSVVLLPTVISFLNSERSSAGIIYPYSLDYYRNFVNGIITIKPTVYWNIIGVQSIIFISLPVFIRKRKNNYPLFWLMAILLLPLLVSKIGFIFCGFSFPNNRWTFVMSFVFSFITTLLINSNTELNKKDLQAIGLFVLLYFGTNLIFEINLTQYIEIQLFIFLIILGLIINKEKIKNKFKRINIYGILLIFMICIGIVSTMKQLYDVDGDSYVSEFQKAGLLEYYLETSNNTISDFQKAVNYLNETDDEYYRISKYPYNYENLSLVKSYNAIGHYYSITPQTFSDLNNDLNNSQYFISKGMHEFDYRTKITTLLGVKYCITSNSKVVPYGYSLMDGYVGESRIYKNDYKLPFGVLYTNYITQEEYQSLNSLEKESSLLKTTVLDQNTISNTKVSHIQDINYEDIIKEIDYEIVDDDNILKDYAVNIKSTNANIITLNIDEIKNCEIYLYIEGLKYNPYNKEDMIELKTKKNATKIQIANVEKEYKWYQPNYSYKLTAEFGGISKSKKVDNITSAYHIETPELLFNLGYYENAPTDQDITLKFSKIGNYTFDNIKVYAVSMEDYEKDIEKLSKSNFVITDYNDGYMNGTINIEENGILQFATLYDKGWSVYVDGEKVNTLISNKYFLGIEVEEGEHAIYLEYRNPYIIPGLIISVLGTTTLLFITFIYRKKKK